MNIHRIKIRNGRVYLEENNDSFFINSNPPNIGPYDSGYYCIGSPTDVEATCHDPSCFYHSGGPIYTWCNTINGPYSTLEECEAACSVVLDPPAPIVGFSYTMENYDSSQRCESAPLLIELCCDNLEDGSITWRWNAPENEDEVAFYVIRRILSSPTRVLNGTQPEGFLPEYNGPHSIADSGGATDNNTTTLTHFEPFVVTSTSGTGDTFSAAGEYLSGSSFYYDEYSGDSDHFPTIGISKIEFSKQFGPKLTFRSSAAKTEFVDTNHEMILGASGSGYTDREYNGIHYLQNNRISNQTDTTISYSGTPSLTIALSGIDHLLEDLENNPDTFLYIQMDYDYAELLIDNCDSEIETKKSPFIISKTTADAIFRTGDVYEINLGQNPSCGYHSYQIIAVNENGQSVQKPNDIETMSTYGSGWIFKGNQEWTVSDDGGSNLIFEWGVGENVGFSGLCPAETGYYFNSSNPSCPGVNGPFISAAECSQAQTDCGLIIPAPCYNQQLSVTLEYVSGILYSRNGDDLTYEASSETPGYLSMPAPPNGWYEFKGIEGRYIEDSEGGTTLCEQETKKCSGGGINLLPYDGYFYVYDGQLVQAPAYPIVN